jgi:hypothetical protein
LKWEYYENPSRKKLYETYSKLITLRTSHSELFDSKSNFSWWIESWDWENGRFIWSNSADNTEKLVVAGNFTNSTKSYSVSFPNTGTWHDYINNTDISVTATPATIEIPANDFRVYTNF